MMPTRRKPYTLYQDHERGAVWWLRGPDGCVVPGWHQSREGAEHRAQLLNRAHALAVKLERARVRRLVRAGKGKRRG